MTWLLYDGKYLLVICIKSQPRHVHTGVGLFGGELYQPLTSQDQNMNLSTKINQNMNRSRRQIKGYPFDYLVVATLSVLDFTLLSLANSSFQERSGVKSFPAIEKENLDEESNSCKMTK